MKSFKDFKKLYEWDDIKFPQPEKVSFMDKLYKRIKEEIMPDIPEEFKIEYDRGHEIILKTGNKKDLSVGIKMLDDNISIYAFPIGEPEYDFTFTFNEINIESIIKTLKEEFSRSKTGGLFKGKKETPKEKEIEDDEDSPILDKPIRIKRSIDVRVIKEVLEDAFIVDDIDLKNVTIEELIRRMLTESRKK